MTDKSVDSTAAREAKEQKIEADTSMENQVSADASSRKGDLRHFSSDKEIAKTLRCAFDTLETRE